MVTKVDVCENEYPYQFFVNKIKKNAENKTIKYIKCSNTIQCITMGKKNKFMKINTGNQLKVVHA